MPGDKPPKLLEVLEQNRPALESALADAERELLELDERRRELQTVIVRARAALGEPTPRAASPPDEDDVPTQALHPMFPAPTERRTLHVAMALVLRENNNRYMTVQELANEVNERRLYEKRDRTLVDPTQIHARANKYDEDFEKDPNDRSRLRLKAGSRLAAARA